jgi:hypothetical protein
MGLMMICCGMAVKDGDVRNEHEEDDSTDCEDRE